jgi:hypothetical protein
MLHLTRNVFSPNTQHQKREVKTRDDVVNLTQNAQACLGEVLSVLRLLKRVD